MPQECFPISFQDRTPIVLYFEHLTRSDSFSLKSFPGLESSLWPYNCIVQILANFLYKTHIHQWKISEWLAPSSIVISKILFATITIFY